MTTDHLILKQIAKEIYIKTQDRKYADYIISEIETEKKASELLKYMKDHPNWNEKELTRKALFIAGVLKHDYS